MTKLTLVKTTQNPPEIKQSRFNRDWMDATYNKHAYQCLPLTVANVTGWELILQQDVLVQWDGGNTVPRILEGEKFDDRPIAIPSIIGMMSFTTGWAFNTEDGYSTWISGSPNYFVFHSNIFALFGTRALFFLATCDVIFFAAQL